MSAIRIVHWFLESPFVKKDPFAFFNTAMGKAHCACFSSGPFSFSGLTKTAVSNLLLQESQKFQGFTISDMFGQVLYESYTVDSTKCRYVLNYDSFWGITTSRI